MMRLPARESSFVILADSVAEVVGKKHLAYVAIRQAGKENNPSRERWASNLFSEISLANRKQIRTTAIDKAYIERDKRRAEDRRMTQPQSVDWNSLFARA